MMIFIQCIMVIFSLLAIRMSTAVSVSDRVYGALTQVWLSPLWAMIAVFSGAYFIAIMSLVYLLVWLKTFVHLTDFATRQGFHFCNRSIWISDNINPLFQGLKRKFILEYSQSLQSAAGQIISDLQEVVDNLKK